MTNKQKFLALVTGEDTTTMEKVRERIKNRAMLRESQKIAINILIKLDELGWSQKKLALKLGVTPQQVNKILRGQENLTLDTQVKLQSILGIPILATFYENKESATKQVVEYKKVEAYLVSKKATDNYTGSGKVIKMETRNLTNVGFFENVM